MEKEIKNNVLVLKPKGRLDASSADTFKEILMNAIEGSSLPVLLDFSQVDYISSMGLRVVLHIAQHLHKNNRKIAFISTKPVITNVFKSAGFGMLFSIYESEQEASQAFN